MTRAVCAYAAAPPITIYSAHDTTVFSLLSALGVTNKAPLPHFASNVVVELWQGPAYEAASGEGGAGGEAWRSGRFHLRVRYNGKPLEGVAGCDGGGGVCGLAAVADATEGRRMAADACEATGGEREKLGADDTSCCEKGGNEGTKRA